MSKQVTPGSIFKLFLFICLIFIVYYFGALNMRLYFPIILVCAGFGYGFYEGLIKKNWVKAREVFGIVVFFGSIWGLIYYFLFD